MQQITHTSQHSNQGWQYQQQQLGYQQISSQQANYKSTGGNNYVNSLQPTQYHQHQQQHSFQQLNNLNQQDLTPQQAIQGNLIAVPRKKPIDNNPIPPTLEGMIGKSNKENSHGSSNQSRSPAYGHNKINQQQQQLQTQKQQQQQQQQLHSQKLTQHHSTGSQVPAKTLATKELKITQQTSMANSLLKQLSSQQAGQTCSKKVSNPTISHNRNTKFSISGVPQQNQRESSSTSGLTASEIQSDERTHSIHSKKTSAIPLASSMISSNSNATKQHLSGSALRIQEPAQVLPIRLQTNQYGSHSSQSSQVSSAKALSNKQNLSQGISAFPSSQQPRQAGHSANSKKEGSGGIVKVFAVNILTKQTSNQSIPCSQPSSTGGSHSNSSRKNMEAQQQNQGQIILTNVRRTESISQGPSAKRNDKRSINLQQNEKQLGNGQFQISNAQDQQNQQPLQKDYRMEQQPDEVAEFIPSFDDQQRLTFNNKYQNPQIQDNQIKQQQYQQQQSGNEDNMLHQFHQQYFQDLEKSSQINYNPNETNFTHACKQIRSSDVIKQNRNTMQFPEKEEILDISKQRCSANNKSNSNSISNNTNFFISPHVQTTNKQPLPQALQKKHSFQLSSQQHPHVVIPKEDFPLNLRAVANNSNLQQYLSNKDETDQQVEPQQTQEFNCDDDENNDDEIPVHNHLLMQQKYSKRIGISVSAVPDIQKLVIPINSIVAGKKRSGVDKNIPDAKRPPQSISHCPFNQQIMAASSVQNQPTPKDSQPQSAKGSKQIQAIVSQGQQNENNLLIKNPHSKERATSSSSSQQVQQQQQKQIQHTNNGNLKSRLHVQKIPSFYQHVSSQPSNLPQNQYYIGNFAGLGSVLPPAIATSAGVSSNGIPSQATNQQQSQFEHFQTGFSTLQVESSKSRFNNFNNKNNNNTSVIGSGNQNGYQGVNQYTQAQDHNLEQQEETIDSQRQFQSELLQDVQKDVCESTSYNSTKNTQFSLFNNNPKTIAENLIEQITITSQSSNLRPHAKQHQQPLQQQIQHKLESQQISQKDNLPKELTYQLSANNSNFNTLPHNNHNNGAEGYGHELGGLIKQQLPNHYYYTLQSNPLCSNQLQQQQSDQLPSQLQNQQAKQIHDNQPGVVSNGSAIWQKGAVNNNSSSNNNLNINSNYSNSSSGYNTLNALPKEDQLFSNKSDRVFGVVGSNSSTQVANKREQNTFQNDQKPGYQSERLNHQLTQSNPSNQINQKITIGINPSSIHQMKNKLNNQGIAELTATANENTIKPQYQMKSSGDSIKSEYYYPQQQFQNEEISYNPPQNPQFQPQSHQSQTKGSHLKANPQAANKPSSQITRIQQQQQQQYYQVQQPTNSQALQLLQQQLFSNNDKLLNISSSSSYLSGAHHLPSQVNQPNHSNKSSNQKANHSASLISPLTHSVTQALSSNSFAGPSSTNLRNLQEKGSLPYISSNTNSAQQQQHQNLLSTAIKSETTQFSNFSSDSPLVCTENISGIFTSRYEDNSQFKNFLSTKTNNSVNNCGTAAVNNQNHSATRQQQGLPAGQPGQNNIQEICLFPQMQDNQQQNQASQQSIQDEQQEDETEKEIETISHKKTLSNHLIKQFGAICKVATEGQEQQSLQIPIIQIVAKSTLNNENIHNINSNTKTGIPFHHHHNMNSQKESYSLSLLGDNKNYQIDPNSADALKQQQQYHKPTSTAAEILEQIHQLTKNEESSQSFASVCSMIVKDENELEESGLQVQSQIDQEQIKVRKQQLLQEELDCFQHEGFMAEQITYFEKCGASDKVEYFPNPDYFDNQKDITFMMRCILLDWMIEVCMELSMKRDTLYVAVNYVDRYLTITSDLSKSKLQLIGVVSLFMAAKVEEIFPPTIQDFAKSADDGYPITEIVQTEIEMLELFDWKLNPATHNLWMTVYTEMWDRFVKCSFDKPNKFQVKFVQDQKLSNKNFIVMYRYPDQKSYTLFRQISQLLDLMLLDINILRFESRMLVSSIMYLQLGIEYRQFSKSQVHNSFNEKYLFANSLNAFNEYFNSFITQHFQFFLVDMLPSLQYVASFFDVEYNYSLPPAASNHKDNTQSQDTYFPAGIEYIRKK